MDFEFGVKVGVHQGSVLSPLLFTIVLEALSREFRVGLPFELLYADDLALLAESEKLLMEKVNRWKLGMEEKGLRVNIGKTKVMRCQPGAGRREQSGKFPCGICKKGVGANSILCNGCGKWIHKKCSKVRGKLKADQGYKCSRCLSGDVGGENVATKAELTMADGKKIELVDKFCYLGDMIGAGGGVEEATRTRVKCAWGKFRELAPILTKRGVSLKIKERSLKYVFEGCWCMQVKPGH